MKGFTSRVSNNYTMDPIETMGSFRVTWKELSYVVVEKTDSGPVKKILNKVSGFFESGQITAIMGPSGCGKSSLLGCISGNKKKGVTGSITISTENNVNFIELFKLS